MRLFIDTLQYVAQVDFVAGPILKVFEEGDYLNWPACFSQNFQEDIC